MDPFIQYSFAAIVITTITWSVKRLYDLEKEVWTLRSETSRAKEDIRQVNVKLDNISKCQSEMKVSLAKIAQQLEDK